MTPAKQYGPKEGGTYVDRAAARWGEAPDWVGMLANAADAAPSLNDLAKRLGIAGASISAVIGRTYPGKLDSIEAKVRGLLMSARVSCPVMGEIGRDACADYQRMPFATSNPSRAQLYRACRSGCENALPQMLSLGERKGTKR